jgi:dihydroorotase-like cyclic amidohydrolase
MASSGRQAEPSSSARKRTDDATGLYVLPGVVDSESHPGCYVPFRHDMTTESKATSMFATKMRFFGRTLSIETTPQRSQELLAALSMEGVRPNRTTVGRICGSQKRGSQAPP